MVPERRHGAMSSNSNRYGQLRSLSPHPYDLGSSGDCYSARVNNRAASCRDFTGAAARQNSDSGLLFWLILPFFDGFMINLVATVVL